MKDFIKVFGPYIVGGLLLFALVFAPFFIALSNRPTVYTQQVDQSGRVCFVPNDDSAIICLP